MIRDTGEVPNLLAYKCILRDYRPIGGDSRDKKCGFDRDPENILISEGDVMNIRTEKGDVVSEYAFSSRGIPFSEASYLFTFLLELDPL